MSDTDTVRFYDDAAERFGDITADGAPDPTLQRFIDALAPGASVLDLGCGHGIASAKLARLGFDVTGLDPSQGLLDVARRLAPTARFTLATFDDLDGTEAYDGIWANFALLHAPRADMPRHLAAIARALRPGGVFHLSMLLGEGEIRDSHGRAYTYYSVEALRALLASAGFDLIQSETGDKAGIDGVHPSIVLLSRKPA